MNHEHPAHMPVVDEPAVIAETAVVTPAVTAEPVIVSEETVSIVIDRPLVETVPAPSAEVPASELAVETPAAQDSSYDLRSSPRWNNAAHAATAKGLKPNSKEWMQDIQETLRQMPDLAKKPKPNHPKKERKEPNGQPRQERRDERPQGQGKKGQGHPYERREQAQGSTGEAFSPAFVNYGAIVSMLLKASRFRRNQYLRSRGDVKAPGDVRDYYTVGFDGPRQSGKTKFLAERFSRDWSTSLFIVPTTDHIAAVASFATAEMKESQAKELLKRVVTAAEVLAELNKYSSGNPANAAAARPKLTIEVDPDDANPAATLSSLVSAYMEEQRAWKEKEPPATHPTLLPLKTVYVDGMAQCESSNLNFGRLVRYLRLGGQTPEIIISQ